MMNFLKEYWLWIVVPIVLVLGGLWVLVAMMEGDETAPFQYNVF